MSLNQVMLIGNLGKDPEVLTTSRPGLFIRLSLATMKKYRDKKGEIQKDTQWHSIYLNNRLGEIAQSYLTKGSKVFVSGELRTSTWKDKEGQSHHSTAIYARELQLLDKKPKVEGGDDDSDIIEEGSQYRTAMDSIRKTLGNKLNQAEA